MPPATSWANPLGRLPHGSVPQSGFLSSTLTLVLVLVVLLAAYAVIQHRSRAADRRYCAWLQAQRGQDVHLLDGVAFRGSGFAWQAGPRWFLVAVAILVFGINTFSIVASSISEPIRREPKFWGVKVVAVPLATMVLLLQLFVTPSKETPAQINHTLVLLLALILLVLAPILTSIPVDSDHGRLSLARKILEHIIGPAALMGGLVAVHRVVCEQLDHEVTQPPSAAYTDDDDDDDYLEEGDEEEGYVYEDDDDDDEGVDPTSDSAKDGADPSSRAAEDELPDGADRADHLPVLETR